MQPAVSQVELARLQAMSVYEQKLYSAGFCRIAGIDEAGRGPLAGPVVAAACILPKYVIFERLNDSKMLSSEVREELFAKIVACAGVHFGLGIVDVEIIDQINILQATFLAMQQALAALSEPADYLLIDGSIAPNFKIPFQMIVKGDRYSISIAAASILAKVTRDRMMIEVDRKWPYYGFKKHKGYATQEHIDAIFRWGPCQLHRKTFEPIKSLLRSERQIKLF